MGIRLGDNIIIDLKFGTKAVSYVYHGDNIVYPDGSGDISLKFNFSSSGNTLDLTEIRTIEGGFVFVNWGDGSIERYDGATVYNLSHTYAEAGEYTIKISGSGFTHFGGVGNNTSIYRHYLVEIISLKMPDDSSVIMRGAFRGCYNLTGSIPAWGANMTSASSTYEGCTGLTGSVPAWGANMTSASSTYSGCTGLTGSIPAWGANMTGASYTYSGCTGLTGSIPAWGANMTGASYTYSGCTGLTGSIPAWGANITGASYTYSGCTGLTGELPAWGANITSPMFTYENCTGITKCSAGFILNPIPPNITPTPIPVSLNFVTGCSNKVQMWVPEGQCGGTRRTFNNGKAIRVSSTINDYVKDTINIGSVGAPRAGLSSSSCIRAVFKSDAGAIGTNMTGNKCLFSSRDAAGAFHSLFVCLNSDKGRWDYASRHVLPFNLLNGITYYMECYEGTLRFVWADSTTGEPNEFYVNDMSSPLMNTTATISLFDSGIGDNNPTGSNPFLGGAISEFDITGIGNNNGYYYIRPIAEGQTYDQLGQSIPAPSDGFIVKLKEKSGVEEFISSANNTLEFVDL